MTDVSTPSLRTATRVANAATAVTSSRTVPATKPNENEAQDALAKCRVAAQTALDLLRNADGLDEGLRGGNTLRLTRLAKASIAPVIDDDEWTVQELRNWVFDVDAIIMAAINVTDDEISQERRDFLTAAHKLVEATATLIEDGALKASTNATTTARLTYIATALRDADRKLELAYDKAESGESLELVLEHIAHDLMNGDVLCMLKPAPTQRDAQTTYEALFKVLAVLDGAVALAQGTVFEPYLREVWQQLDGVQTACDSTTNCDLPAGEDEVDERPCDQLFTALATFQTAAAIIESQWQDVPDGGGAYGAARALVEPLAAKFEEQVANKGLTLDDCEDISCDLSVIENLMSERCEEWANQCLWGALYLLRQCKDLVDTVEFPKEAVNA